MNGGEMPALAEIVSVETNTSDTKTFTVRYAGREEQKRFKFVPGTFMMVSVFGFGEVPISISSSPYKTSSIKFTVVDAGNATHAMHLLGKGSRIGLRGPFGKGFPMQKFRKKNLLFVSGGCGLAPLRSAIYFAEEKKQHFGSLSILFGCKTPSDILFGEEQGRWEKEGFSVLSTVDKPDKEWKGNVGVVTKLFSRVDLDPAQTIALLCGPPVMIKFALQELRKKGFGDGGMYASLERMMHCGNGKCAHCNIGGRYVCRDGPVFCASELKEMPVEES